MNLYRTAEDRLCRSLSWLGTYRCQLEAGHPGEHAWADEKSRVTWDDCGGGTGHFVERDLKPDNVLFADRALAMVEGMLAARGGR